MRYIDKLVNYFLSSYMNNNKLRNYPNALLKLFFERNNKNISLISNLGNVFRNSKWSDFKIQNIKLSFINQYISIWGMFFTLLLVYFLLVTHLNPNLSISYWFVRSGLYDYYRDISFTISVSVSALYAYITSRINHKVDIISKTIFTTSSQKTTSIPTGKLLPSNNLTVFDLRIVQSLYKVKYNLDLAEHSKYMENFINSLNPKIYIPTNLNYTYTPIIITLSKISKTPQYELNQIGQVGSFDLLNLGNHIYILDQNPLTPYTVNKLKFETSLNYNNLKQVTDIAKQDRWLLKNSPINFNTLSASQMHLESKKLINQQIVDSKTSDSNLWLSNFTSGTNLNISDVLTQSNLNLLKNYNFFEESIYFFNKRYTFLVNQRVLNSTQSITPQPQNNIFSSELMQLPYNIEIQINQQSLSNLNRLMLNNLIISPKSNYINTSNPQHSNDFSSDLHYTSNNLEILNTKLLVDYLLLSNTNTSGNYKLDLNTNLSISK